MPQPTATVNGISRFFGYPLVGLIGTIASVIGITLAVYFYFEGQSYRDLRFFVHPARAVVVKAGQTSRLSITLDDQPVKKDVSAVQVAFWNEGKQSIRQENILRPLVIRLSSKAPILEAEIRKQSREVVEIKLDRTGSESGQLAINWNILEHHDGAIVQLIYLDNTAVSITATATIEGQGEIEDLTYAGKIQSPPQNDFATGRTFVLIFGGFSIGMGIFMGGFVGWDILKRRRQGIRGLGVNRFIIFIPILMVLSIGVFMIWSIPPIGPPFGF